MQTTVTATPTHPGATVAFKDGADNALTNPVTLAVGANVIKAVVTAEDTTTMKTYMVTVTLAPAIVTDGVQLTSTPATGDTYGRGETIEITVIFDSAVMVGGTPRIAFHLDGGLRWAEYSRHRCGELVPQLAVPQHRACQCLVSRRESKCRTSRGGRSA